jgi:hypothetical protein
VAVPLVWWLRNSDVDGTWFGRRSDSRFDASEVLRQFPDGLSSLALPHAAPELLRLVVLVPLLVAAVLAWRRSAAPRIAVVVLTVAAVAYAGAVTLAATQTLVDPIDTRLLSPVVVPLAVLVALGVSSPTNRLEQALAGFALALVAAMAVLAPGVAWRGHDEERDLSRIPDDVSCAEWPAAYSEAAVRVPADRG